MERSQESLLVQLRKSARLELQRTRATIQEALTSAISEVVSDPSMSRSGKRARLYKIKRNYETQCEISSQSYNRAYGMFDIHCLPEELMPEFSISNVLSTDVIILSEPHDLPCVELQPAAVLSNSTTGFVSSYDIRPTQDIQYVPVCLQPLTSLARHTYDVLPSIAKKKISFISYFRLTVLQTYDYLSKFGLGVVPSSSKTIDFPEENFPEVCAFLRTLRPCFIKDRMYVGVLVRSQHHFYNYRRSSGSRKHYYLEDIGDVLSDAAPSIEVLRADVSQFKAMADCLKSAYKRGEECIHTGSIYSDGSSRKLGGDQCILTHQLLWLKRMEYPERKFIGSCNLYHHGYFYDPTLGISYLTSSLALILSKLELVCRNLRQNADDSPSRQCQFTDAGSFGFEGNFM